MTKFADQLFDDLIREHGSSLTNARPPAPRGHLATRRALLAVGGGGVAVAAAAGVLVATAGTNPAAHSGQVAGGKTPAYAVTNNPNGTVTLAVYQKDGIAGANAKLHELGDSQVYVVPVGAGCPSMSSLPAPAASLNGKHLTIRSRQVDRRLGDREREGHPGRRHPRGGGRDNQDRQHDDVTRGGEADHGARAELREPAIDACAASDSAGGQATRHRDRPESGHPGLRYIRREAASVPGGGRSVFGPSGLDACRRTSAQADVQ